MRGKPRKALNTAVEVPQPTIDSFRGQHLALAQRDIATELGRATVTVDESESPLAWLARRRGRDGRALIEPHQLLAGERLRADFTRANLMPRTTSNWASPISSGMAISSSNCPEQSAFVRGPLLPKPLMP